MLAAAGGFSILQIVQSVSQAHEASSLMGTGLCSQV